MDLLFAGTIVILIGFAIVLVASMSSSHRGGEEKTGVRGGGVVMIGPIPIIFGSDTRWAVVAIALAIVLMALSLVIYVW